MFLDAPVMISGKSNYHFLNDRVCAKIKKSDSEFDCVSVNYPPPPPPLNSLKLFTFARLLRNNRSVKQRCFSCVHILVCCLKVKSIQFLFILVRRSLVREELQPDLPRSFPALWGAALLHVWQVHDLRQNEQRYIEGVYLAVRRSHQDRGSDHREVDTDQPPGWSLHSVFARHSTEAFFH